MITLPTSQLPLIASLLGGFLFGFGMMLANCCGSGAWFRTGEGALGSLIALLFFALTMASTQTGVLKHWLNPLLENPVEIDNIHLTLGISLWILVAVVVLITAGLFIIRRKIHAISHQRKPRKRSFFRVFLQNIGISISRQV